MNKPVRFTFFLLLTLMLQLLPAYLFAQKDKLRQEINTIIKSVDAEVGVALMDLQDRETLVFNGRGQFPMQSVFKFPLALAVLHQVDEGKLSLDQKILVKKEAYIPKTWSPLAKKYPEGNVELSIRELLAYTVSESDNNGCDILFDLLGGPGQVHAYVRSLGVKGINIVHTEAEMHQGWEPQFKNWSHPKAMLQLLDKAYRQNILSESSYQLFWKMMEDTPTGPNRLKGLLPSGTVVAHKTGTGGQNGAGEIGAVNDVGIIKLPNGKELALVVFVTKTKVDYPKLEEVIARISKAAYDYYL